MVNTLFLPELREMLEVHDSQGLSEFCSAIHPAGTAEFMAGLTAAEAWQVLLHADLATRVEIFSYFEHPFQVEILHSQDRQQMAELISAISSDDRVDMLRGVEAEAAAEILSLVPSKERRDILRLQAYPEGTAGAVMTTDVACLSESWTVKQALDRLQERGEEFETIYYLYIVDDLQRLRGLVSARKLVSCIGKPQARLGDIMETELVTVDADEDQEEVARLVARYDLLAIPVVDDQHRMLGIITYDDIIDVLQDEATEDAYRIAAVAPLKHGYLDTPLLTLSWKRGIWLCILFFASAVTAIALCRYEQQITQWQWLVFFLPLITSCGGNSGNQAATLVITGLARNDIQLDQWWLVIRRELVVGAILGLFLGICGTILAPLLRQEVLGLPEALVIPITLVSVVMCGTMLGSILPLVFHRLGLDPALMSNPFVAGLVDILGIFVYMNVAHWLLG